jgi:hypothetical protein
VGVERRLDFLEGDVSISKIPEKVRYLLWAKSAGRCEFNGCNKALYQDSLTKIELNFGEVAHIIGDSPNGPRGNVELSKEYCSDVSNLMLMCPTHHRMIDEICQSYSDDVLRQMKEIHESRMVQLTTMVPDKTSQVVFYKGRVGNHFPKIDRRDAWLAMIAEWYPANRLPIELGMSNSVITDDEEEYWRLEEKNLRRQFQTKVIPIINSSNERNHFSIFAFAPQPLLILLGTLFSDIYPAEVYQLHREPTTWKWQPGPENFEYLIDEPSNKNKVVALIFSLSADINNERIEKSLSGKEISIWRMRFTNPNNDFLRSKEQLQLFRENYRELLNRIKAKHSEDSTLHIFPATPISIAIEIGRVWQPKADLPMVIYDQSRKRDGFTRTLSIG